MKKILFFILGILLFNILSAQNLTPLQKADSSFKNKDYKNAIELYNKVLKKSSDTIKKDIYYQVGECYRFGNNYNEAKNLYDKAISAGCTNPLVNLHIGEMLIFSGDYSVAKTYIEKYLQQVPNDELAKLRIESCNINIQGQKMKPLYEVNDQKDLSSSSSDYSVSFVKKDKIYLSSTRIEGLSKTKIDAYTLQGFSDIFESTYDAQKAQWSKPSRIQGSVNTSYNEGTFTFDSTRKYGYYTQCNGAKGKLHQCNIMYARYDEASNKWENSQMINYNSQTFRIQQPCLLNGGKAMIFSSDMSGGLGGADLYIIKKVNDTVWGQPENLGTEINSIGNEGFPFVSGDTVLYYASDGKPGFGGLDIFKSTIKNGKFSKPTNLMPPINSSSDDFGLVYFNNKEQGFFCSNRPGGLGDDDIYTYDLIPVILTVKGNVKDKSSNKNLSDAIVFIKGSDGTIDSVETSSDGSYTYSKLKSNVHYTIRATKKRYMNDSKTLNVGTELYSKTFDKSLGLDLDFSLIRMTRDEIRIDNIYYDYDKADLRDDSKPELDKLINVLKETPEVNVQISSHTDERGEKNYNLDLSQRRAQSVVNYLVAGGISAKRLTAKGYGFSMPLIKGAKTEDEHQKNRRTTFKILDTLLMGNASDFQSDSKQIYSKQTSSQESMTKPVNPSAEIFSDNKFFIIAGSYNSETEANDAVAKLKTSGYPIAEVVGQASKGKWRVAYAGFKTKEEADKELSKIKQKISSAWLFEKK